LSQEDWEQNRAEGFRYCAIVEQEAIAALAAVWTYSPTHWEVAAVSTAPAFRKMGYGKFHVFQEGVSWWIKPPTTSLVLGTLADLYRSKTELLAENALLRQQLIILRRQVKRPSFQKTDRFLLVLLARIVRTWKQALFLVQPETLLRWHRELFRLFWKRKSKVHQPRHRGPRNYNSAHRERPVSLAVAAGTLECAVCAPGKYPAGHRRDPALRFAGARLLPHDNQGGDGGEYDLSGKYLTHGGLRVG
jgi:hypothetical protein